MKIRFLALLALTLATTVLADQIGPYQYTYNGSPVSAPVTAINPPPGSIVIDTSTGVHYRKIGAVGSNSNYAVEAVQLITTSTPLTGATITASNSQSDETVVITPAGTIAALTFVFPSNANSRIGQQITLQSSQIVTTLTLTKGGQTITDPAGTALAANVPQRWIKTAASTWVRMSNVATDSGVVLTASVITNGLTASGSASNDFSGSTGTFKTSTGANTIGGAVTVDAATTPSITLATGKTNTGFLTILGKTSGGLKLLPVDAAGQTVTLSLAAQTSGAATLTINDLAGVAGSVLTSTLTTNTPGAANSVWGASNGLIFEGATADAFEGTLTLSDVTADRTWTLPDRSGTVRLSQTPAAPALSADNQAITPGADNYIAFTSDNTTATNRTFTIAAIGAVTGQVYVFVCDVANSTGRAEVASTGIQKLNGTMSFDAQYDSLTCIFDGTNFVELARTHR